MIYNWYQKKKYTVSSDLPKNNINDEIKQFSGVFKKLNRKYYK